jgi:histidinol dehydrogenase
MTIGIIQGFPAARDHLLQLRTGRDRSLPETMTAKLKAVFGRDISPEEAVAQIVTEVRRDGDAALRDYGQRIDGIPLGSMTTGPEAIERAYQATPPELREALHLAADRIRSFHEREPRHSWLEWDGDGGALGQRVDPLRRVGIYVPGGTAAYPSSLLMAVIPAQVAGVEEIAVTTPPFPPSSPPTNQRVGGAQAILAAARVADLEQVFTLGGAQAIAALAYGTETIPRVDKIVGAGGLFVTLAKRLVYGDVGIDGLYGPTETLLIADDHAAPAVVAADLLAQAEHDPLATALLITSSAGLAATVQSEVARQVGSLERRAIIEASLKSQGAILVIDSMEEALVLANEYAPEHLCLLVGEPWSLVGRVRNAGGIFVGESSSEALGDYVVGPSHIMPTGGTARFASPLRVADFCRVTSIFATGRPTAQRLAQSAQILAQAEGLTAHAAAVAARTGGGARTEP